MSHPPHCEDGIRGDTARKLTRVTLSACPKLPGVMAANWLQRNGLLVEVFHGASSGAARISATSTASAGGTWGGRALRGYGENGQLRRKLFAMALWTIRLLVAVYQRFERVATFSTDVFKNRHLALPVSSSNTI
jgi:hypothetical protein